MAIPATGPLRFRRRMIVNSMLERLINLQKTDEKIVAFQQQEEAIPKELEELELELKTLENKKNQVDEELEGLSGREAELEALIKETRDQMRKSQTRMLAVKTQREYRAVQREGEIARKRRGELEAEAKELDAEVEEVRGNLESITGEMDSKEEILKKARRQANKKLKNIVTDREDLEKTRKIEAGFVDSELLGRYQKVFRRHRGQGVVNVAGGVCGGCFMRIPPQLYNQVLAQGSVHQCPSCSRIIYVDET